MQDWIGDRLARIGFAVERLPQQEWGDDLIARKRGSGPGPGAADRPRRHGLPGRHGGAAAGHDRRRQAARTRHLRHEGRHPHRASTPSRRWSAAGWDAFEEITFLIVSDEEIEQRHSVETLRAEGPKHHAVLTLEAARANGDIVTSRKATRWFRIEAKGKAAHAGVEPEKGASATLALAHVIVESFKLNGRKPGMTLNPGRIDGGANPNIVADEASVLVDIRAWTNAELDELAGRLQTDRRDRVGAGGDADDAPATADPGCRRWSARRAPIRLEEHAIRIAGELGFPLKGAATGGGSDVSIAVHAGTPGLDGLGPIGGLDHGPDEYILVESIVPRTALLAKLLMAICADEELTHA